MPLIHRSGDILLDDAEALVNPVNCLGVMGAGLALQFKTAYPLMFREYAARCRVKEVRVGRMSVHDRGKDYSAPRWIINFPTKRHYANRSELPDIAAGLDAFVDLVRLLELNYVALPRLGCGLGGLSWDAVLPLIEAAAARLEPDVELRVYSA